MMEDGSLPASAQGTARPIRETERSLLGIVMLMSLTAGFSLSLARNGTLTGEEAALCFVSSAPFAMTHLVFVAKGFDGDELILPLAGAATVMGYPVVYRLRPDLAVRQLAFIWLGSAVMAVLAILQNQKKLEGWGVPALGGSIALLVLTLMVGEERGGARSWLFLGDMGFQTSELAKITCILAGAEGLSKMHTADSMATARASAREIWECSQARRVIVMWAAVMLLTVAQRDVGTAMVIYISCVAMAYVATGNRLLVLVSIGIGAAAVAVAGRVFPHVGVRFSTWLNPWADAAGSGYQVTQSIYALASGGILGRGYGCGSPWLIPAAVTDMLFSASAEEIGLAGSIGLIAIYFLMVGHGYACAQRADSRYSALVAVGAANMIAVQTFVIIGGNLGVLPLTGVTLPLASYGGSSMLTSLAIVGILLGSTRRLHSIDGGALS
ncbi:MAG TPA: FtsW/RodA/SpoVE family cell cycle protein [Bacillota bacterium]|nr:FtsW/RodA/SpoVE family cell cycle protein [Bacillota bacterium]